MKAFLLLRKFNSKSGSADTTSRSDNLGTGSSSHTHEETVSGSALLFTWLIGSFTHKNVISGRTIHDFLKFATIYGLFTDILDKLLL